MQARGREVVIAPVDGAARADPDAIRPGVALVSVGLANNEVGTVQPVAQIVERAHDAGALVHIDACAGPRWIRIPPGADLLSLSGHKLGAVAQPLRAALTGRSTSPGVFDVLAVLGREESLARIGDQID